MKQTPFEDPYYDRLRTFLDVANSETDRGHALIAASLIEEMLEEILRAFLLDNVGTKNLFNISNAPFSTFFAKASACRALGLISNDEFRDIELVRKIRNAFAHSIMCSFSDQNIRNWAISLKVGMAIIDSLEKNHKSRSDEPKQRFSMVTTSLIASLYNRAHYVKKIKLKETVWPI